LVPHDKWLQVILQCSKCVIALMPVTPCPAAETPGCHWNWISIVSKAHGIYLFIKSNN